MRYCALLRGVNVSGKNKLPMPQLKEVLETSGYSGVSTYLNSGNVLFSSDDTDTEHLASEITELIHEQFGLEIPVYIIPVEHLKDILLEAPEWWGSEDPLIYDNLIFVLPSSAAEEICTLIGEPSEGLEQIQVYQNVIFWSFDRKKYQKAHWWKKTAEAGIGEHLTIRTAGTLRKLCEK